ncbi:MAG: DUF1353 domain-containing protein [Deltaproteobacteria bacterium]|nr:DUF1353 domain-containing protein [Deltaproteobacteria bacterium]
MSKFTEVLVVSPLADGKTWVTRKEFGYDIGEEGSGNTIDVPIGFMTDFASIPRPLWVILPRWGKYGNAAVIHDYCYWEQSRSRLEADRIFREAMEVLQVPRWKVRAMYYSVRLGAGLAWSGNRRKKEKGISRIAAVMPVKSVEVPKSLQAKG